MRKTLEERFWEKVDKRGEHECWNWTASTRGAGVLYGIFFPTQARRIAAHILSYTMAHGEIPAGLCVLHRCDNGLCVNPDHLFLGTRSDNTRDMEAKGRGRHESWKITKDDALIILQLRFDAELTLREIAELYDLTQPYISSLCHGRRRPDVYEDYMASRQVKAA